MIRLTNMLDSDEVKGREERDALTLLLRVPTDQ